LTDLDPRTIIIRIDLIHESLRILKEMLAKGRDAFETDPYVLAIAERHTQLAAQAALDIADHIILAAGWKMAETYKDTFRVLGRHKVLDFDLSRRLEGLAGLRNILVHLYLEIDPDKFFDDLSSGLDDLEKFCNAVVRFLDSQT